MQTHLYIHKENAGIPQVEYRGRYVLKHVDYALSRTTNRKGEINSEMKGGEIRVVIDGFADATILRWLFDALRKENGQVVTLDEYTQNVTKFYFSGATITKFRINYDSRMKNGLATLITILAEEIVTDNDLIFQNR